MKNCLKYYTEFREKYECERGSTKHGAMANILICLEKAIQNGNDYRICKLFTSLNVYDFTGIKLSR